MEKRKTTAVELPVLVIVGFEIMSVDFCCFLKTFQKKATKGRTNRRNGRVNAEISCRHPAQVLLSTDFEFRRVTVLRGRALGRFVRPSDRPSVSPSPAQPDAAANIYISPTSAAPLRPFFPHTIGEGEGRVGKKKIIDLASCGMTPRPRANLAPNYAFHRSFASERQSANPNAPGFRSGPQVRPQSHVRSDRGGGLPSKQKCRYLRPNDITRW